MEPDVQPTKANETTAMDNLDTGDDTNLMATSQRKAYDKKILE